MGDYEGTTTVDIPQDELFEYLSRIENLPKYMSRMTEAHSVTGDEVSVEAKLEPEDVGATESSSSTTERTVQGEAWFRIDADARRLEWGAEGPHDYHGELAVSATEDGATASRVVVRLHTTHDDVPGIEHGLNETLENIERLTLH
jgi:uncharacterized membrane protein